MTTNPDLLLPNEVLYGEDQDGFQIMVGRMRRHYSDDPCENGKWRFTYNLFFTGKLMFAGHEFLVPPGMGESRNKTLSEILAWLSLKPGDTDADYFDDYTVEQLAFVVRYGDDLFQWSEEIRERQA